MDSKSSNVRILNQFFSGFPITILWITSLFLITFAGCQAPEEVFYYPIDSPPAAEENLAHTDPGDQPETVPATPDTIHYRLPDDYELRIFLRGDEYNHIAMTVDGYLLTMNNDGFYEYAIRDEDGTLLTTGMIARNEEDRTEEIKQFLEAFAIPDNH